MSKLKDLMAFLDEVWREVRPDKGRVTWPDWKAIRISTIVVIIASFVLAGYIFVCDSLLNATVGKILSSAA